MATKSKSTDIFKGLLSWLCLLALLCGLCIGVVLSVRVLVDPSVQSQVAENLQAFAGENPGAFAEAAREEYEELQRDVVEEEFEEAVEPGTFSGPAVIDAAAKQEEALYQRVVQIVCAVAILLTALVLVFAFRKDRRQFEALVAGGLGKMWMEVKCLCLMVVLFLSLVLISELCLH